MSSDRGSVAGAVDRSCGFDWEPPAQKLTLDGFVYIWRKGEVAQRKAATAWNGMESASASASEHQSHSQNQNPKLIQNSTEEAGSKFRVGITDQRSADRTERPPTGTSKGSMFRRELRREAMT
ncbi:GM14414 [Drosophila sechellia]|uniref:GM14414 n=1 Tax=Drosophila sechellia TaxID=7238 RepID=B4HVT5_DROSE|nr:GM14414 [Drosophila sechellia]